MVVTEASVAQTKANLFRRGAPASSGAGAGGVVPAVDESRSSASVVASALLTA